MYEHPYRRGGRGKKDANLFKPARKKKKAEKGATISGASSLNPRHQSKRRKKEFMGETKKLNEDWHSIPFQVIEESTRKLA